ncbi:MAG: hypothetical protein IT158_16180 [Bryobacterales bacterium]|nr:hypothetical protein [Bryobacterales bacterium]
MKKLMFLFMVLAVSFASAKTYSITLFQPSVVAGTELKPGDYKLDVNGEKVVISKGSQKVESAVKVENNGERFRSTTVRYATGEGKYTVQEIRLGGTNTKLMFN